MDTNLALDMKKCPNETIWRNFAALSQYINFVFPFAILTELKKLLFSTNTFDTISKKYPQIMDRIFQEDGLNELDFRHEKFLVSKKRFAVCSNRENLFIIQVVEQSEDYQQALNYTHDIQAPLRNISNFLQLIDEQLRDLNNSSVNSYLRLAIDNIQKLSDLNVSYLNLERNRVETYQNFNAVIKDIQSLLQTQIKARNCKIQVIGEIPDILCDYHNLFSLLKNLVENSLKHAIASNLVIKITKLFENEKTIKIRFEDNGTELSAEKKLKIERLLEGKREGSNLGVFICGNIIQKFHGTIKLIDNKPGCAYDIDFCNLKRNHER